MKIVFHKTRNAILQKYLEGYYFISEDDSSSMIRYKTFPNNYSILSISRFADIVYENNKIVVTPSKTNEISTDLVLRYTNPIEVTYEKAVDEITFYFKPLGLNHFISDASLIAKHKEIMSFVIFPDFNNEMLAIFNTNGREKQIEKIEQYWLAKLQVKNLAFIQQLLHEVENSSLSIDDVAIKMNISRQYVNKLFMKHIGKSPAEYRKVHRFRNAIKSRNAIQSLTEISHGNLFYDQSHFNKNIKAFTDCKPSVFFKKVDVEKEIIWFYL